MIAKLCALAAVTLVACSAAAQEPAGATPPAATTPAATPPPAATPAAVSSVRKTPEPAGGSTIQLALYLVLLLALFAGGAYLLRNGFTLLPSKLKGERKLLISETKMLGNRQFLVVAEYEGRKMLLGVCPGRIDHLCTLGGAEPEFPDISPEKDNA